MWHLNVRCHICEWVVEAYVYTKTIYMNKSCRIWMSRVTYGSVMPQMNESCHVWMSHATYEWVMSHVIENNTKAILGTCNESHNESFYIWTSHVTCHRTHVSLSHCRMCQQWWHWAPALSHITCERVMSHVTNMNESCQAMATEEISTAMSHAMSRVIFERVMSRVTHVNELFQDIATKVIPGNCNESCNESCYIWTKYVTNEICHVSHTWMNCFKIWLQRWYRAIAMSHATSRVILEWDMSHVTYKNESCHV